MKNRTEGEKAVPWVNTIDLTRVPWINDPAYKNPKKTFGENLTLWFVDARDPSSLEQQRRIRHSMGLYPVSLAHQNVTVILKNGEDAVWGAANFFETMPLEMFMAGPNSEGWNEWCWARDRKLFARVVVDKTSHLEGLDQSRGG